MELKDLPTPSLVIDMEVVQANLKRMADYAAAHGLKLRPHTKTHKSLRVAKMQIDAGATGLTVAKVGEAGIMSQACEDLLVAYPTADPARCKVLAQLADPANQCTVRVAIDSTEAADVLANAAEQAGTTLGILVDIDVGFGRTGVQSCADALALAQHIEQKQGLRLDGIMVYPGHVGQAPDQQAEPLGAIQAKLADCISLWAQHGLEAKIVSGGSTPSAFQSHLIPATTEIRPGTYVYNDMNCVRGGFAALDQCAAKVISTVVSSAVPGQVIIDAGSKTLTSDRCGPDPESGHGHIIEFPKAKITKLTEEHGQVDISACDSAPKIGQRLSVIPNHICPCVNLHDQVWVHDGNLDADGDLEPMKIDARGLIF